MLRFACSRVNKQGVLCVLAAANCGLAMGGAGTDTAIESADMALMQDDLGPVAEAIHLGR
jgi:cation transport ATPase